MNVMSDGEIRLECLRLANREHADPKQVVATAQEYFDFISRKPVVAEDRKPGTDA